MNVLGASVEPSYIPPPDAIGVTTVFIGLTPSPAMPVSLNPSSLRSMIFPLS